MRRFDSTDGSFQSSFEVAYITGRSVSIFDTAPDPVPEPPNMAVRGNY